MEAAALQQAATVAEEQKKLREAAEREAERVREEMEVMRKQMVTRRRRERQRAEMRARVEKEMTAAMDVGVRCNEALVAAFARRDERHLDEGEQRRAKGSEGIRRDKAEND